MFFVAGPRLLELADISRIRPADDGSLAGFQRPRIREQVRAIGDYLSRGDVLFPNAIILALTPETRFVAARGPRPEERDAKSTAGTLSIPVRSERAAAWIVDGQQRTLALAERSTTDLPVPVVGFVSDTIAEQREQFILVNKARPLPRRLIDELLPEVDFPLPRDLSARKIPSVLCNALNEHRDSPFRGLIRRPASEATTKAVIMDSALIRVMARSVQDPRGALAAHVAPDGCADVPSMFVVMLTFWNGVKEVFAHAWGLPPDRSRLMHSAGIEAMGVLMDQIMTRDQRVDHADVEAELRRIVPFCRWTSGRWDAIDRDWNDIQSTPRDVRLLANYLVTLQRQPPTT
jgi:DGQHR domain-containing protein